MNIIIGNFRGIIGAAKSVLATAFLSYSGTSLAEAVKDDLFALSIQDLLNVKVLSVSKQEQRLSDSAASIYVITNRDIRTAGVTTLPDALRLDPRLQVAQINASQYAISIRGFNNPVSNKLLVLIDGRTVYTPLFSGVFWDQQDLMLDDIDRIEVISGPGGTLWGTNAVNGVINIITRTAKDTAGILGTVQAGNNERGVQLRYGGEIGKGYFRVYGKYNETNSNRYFKGGNAFDGGDRVQGGFRADWEGNQQRFTLQGDAYDGTTEDRGTIAQYVLGAIETSGANLLGRWQKQFDGGSDLRVQTYWDYMKRRDTFLFQPKSDIFDLDLQHHIPFNRHSFIWGGGYRYGKDEVLPGLFTEFVPATRSLEWKSLFGMGEIQVTSRLKTTLGLRLEHNDYTGLEYLPTIRLGWKRDENSLLWTSLARSVRAPSRYDKDVYAFVGEPRFYYVVGGPNFESEVADVISIGYRTQAFEKLTYSVTAFYHDWEKLRSGTAIPVRIENKIEGDVYGLEFWADYQISSSWKLSLGGTRLEKDLRLHPDSTDPVGIDNETLANDPDYYGQVRSTFSIGDKSSFELSARRVAELPMPQVPAYTAIDATYIRNITRHVDLSIRAENLADKVHYEYGDETYAIALRRSIWFSLKISSF